MGLYTSANSSNSNINWFNFRVVNRKEDKKIVRIGNKDEQFKEMETVYAIEGNLVKVKKEERKVTTKGGNEAVIRSIYLYIVNGTDGAVVEFNMDNFVSAGGMLMSLLSVSDNTPLYNQWLAIRCSRSKKDEKVYFNYYLNGEWLQDPRGWYEDNKPIAHQLTDRTVYDDARSRAFVAKRFEELLAIIDKGREAKLPAAAEPERKERNQDNASTSAKAETMPADNASPVSSEPGDDLPF